MTPDQLHFFADEMQKLAYEKKQHAALGNKMINAAAGGKAGPGAKQIAVGGALDADKGIRHPWLPHTDPIHSFAGSQTKAMVGANVAAKQKNAVGDITKSIAGRQKKGLRGIASRALSGMRGARGLANLGEAHHQMVDISAHYDKPVESGLHTKGTRGAVAGHLRDAVPKSGYGGGAVAGLEHSASGVKRDGVNLSANLDRLKPSASAADAHAVTRTQRLGQSTRKQVESKLVREHGLHPEHATREAGKFFTEANPGRVSRAVGEASRDLNYAGGEVRRAGSAVGRGLRGLAKRVVRHL